MKKLLTTFLLLGLSGIQPLFAEMEAYSEDDTFLGYVVDIEDSETIMTSNGKIVSLDRDGTVYDGSIYYLTDNCTGTPYLMTGVKGLIVSHNSTNYEAIGGVPISDAASMMDSYSPNCNEVTWESIVIEAKIIPDSTIPFTIPVSMPIHIKINPKVVVIPM